MGEVFPPDHRSRPQPLEVRADPIGEVQIVRLSGRLDSATAEEFDSRIQQFAAGTATRMVLDLSHVDYVSSAGLRSLLGLLKQVKAQGGTLVLAAVQPRVADILEIAGFRTLFAIANTCDEALASLQPNR